MNSKPSGFDLFAVAVHHERAAERKGDEERDDRSRKRRAADDFLFRNRQANQKDIAIIELAASRPLTVGKGQNVVIRLHGAEMQLIAFSFGFSLNIRSRIGKSIFFLIVFIVGSDKAEGCNSLSIGDIERGKSRSETVCGMRFVESLDI